MTDFVETGINPDIIKAISELGYESPTPIQAKTIPLLLASEKQDVIALAQTGTGKTAAFGLPTLHLTDVGNNQVQALVLCPTRELCIQIMKDLEAYSKYMKGLKVLAVYGGTSIEPQIRALRSGVHVVVGTPGRTRDLIKRGKLKIDNIERVILDEADEMLTMGFKEELDAILENTPEEKQTLLFSATISPEISKIAKSYMDDPIEIAVAKANTAAKNVEHWYYLVKSRDKYEVLKRVADLNPNIYAIVFCRTRRDTQEVASKLMADGYNADFLNGDLSQAQRDDVMHKFRQKQITILVATDVAARGVDVNELTHVINYTLPDDPEVYVHRSGRTGRAGKSGVSIAIIHSREKRRIQEAERKARIKFERKKPPTGREVCEIQLLNMVDKVREVEVNEEDIEPFLPQIYEKLEDLDREALIKRFVSTEFNRFLDYYKRSRDLEADEDRGDRNSRRDRRERRGRDRRDRRDRRDDRFNDTERPFRPGRGDSSGGDFTRLVLNAGSEKDMHPSRLIGLINHTLDSNKANIGRIKIQRNVSYVDIERSYADDLMDGLRRQEIDGERIVVEKDEGRSPRSNRENRGRREDDGKGGKPKIFSKKRNSDGSKARHRNRRRDRR